MPDKILVAYATGTGSTAGVAEAIGQTLAESGAAVDVRPMADVTDLTPYTAVVAGSAIRAGAWLPEAMASMRTHQAALARQPFATFTVCMTMAMKNQAQSREAVSKWLAPVRALARPVSEGLFAGVLDLAKVPTLKDRIMFQISVWMGVWKAGDNRDWDAIRAWASELPAKLAQ